MIRMNDSKVNVGIGKVPIKLQSAQSRVLIKNGTVVNHDEMFSADVYIEDGIIKQVGKNLSTPGGIKIVDAGGRLIIPGGIDTHTHMEAVEMGTTTCDDFYTGTRAALAGGTTMIMDFVLYERGKSLLDAYNECRAKADSKVCCDYALHFVVLDFNSKVAGEMETLVKEKGINSFKIYQASSSFQFTDEELYDIFKRCKQVGALAMVHAENGVMNDKLAQDVLNSGVTGPEGILLSRPEDLEADAVGRVIILADQANCPVYIVHVNSIGSAQKITEAKRSGKIVFGESIAAALGADGSHYGSKCWRHAAGYVMSPPLRNNPSTPSALMKLLAVGDLECTGSDHCVYNTEQKSVGFKDFRKIPSGLNGVEDRMTIIWEKGVEAGILDPCKFVAVTSSNSAKVFNIYPRKGRIAVGSDADIVIWDPQQTRVISASTHHSKVDFNIFESMVCHGVPVLVMTGGRIVLDTTPDSDLTDLRVTQGAGKFVETPAFSHYVYGRVSTRDKLKVYSKVEREGDAIVTAAFTAPTPVVSEKGKQPTSSDDFHIGKAHLPRGSLTGIRNQQDSTIFSNDTNAGNSTDRGSETGRKHYHPSIRTHQPPGGASSGSLW